MITNETPRVRSLLRQADRNLEAGKLVAAEDLYRQIIEEAPESTAAWLGLAKAVRSEAERREACERVLALEPDNETALALLNGEPLPSPQAEASADLVVETAVRANSAAEAGTPAPQAEIAAAGSPTLEWVDPDAVDLTCYRHPSRSTSLRCYKCSKPICSECTEKTPVGYLCPDCYREAEDAFFNTKATDYLIAAAVALPLSLIAGYLVMQFSRGIFFIIIMFFIGGAVGGLIGRLTKRAIGQRRGRYIPHLVAACVIIGVLVWALPLLLLGAGALFSLIGPGVYLATSVSSAYYWAR